MLEPEQQRRLARIKLDKEDTPAEKAFECILQELGVHYMKQKGFMVGLRTFVIADFYLPKPYKTVIEIDGEYHENVKQYDEYKDSYYRSRGFKVLRFKNDTVFNFRENVKSILIKHLFKGKLDKE